MNFWQVLRDRPGDLERVCFLTPHSRAEQDAAYDLGTDDDLERARRVWVLLSQGRGSNAAQDRLALLPRPSRVHLLDARLPHRLRRAGSVQLPTRIHGVSLECRDALEVARDYGKHPNVLLYCDPPYLATSRNSTNYRHEMATETQHVELAETLHGCAASVVLSGYPSPLYDDLFGDWDRIDLAGVDRQRHP